jgi:fructokinase
MTSGPAIRTRSGRPPEELEPGDAAWTFEVHYLSMALVNYICVLSPERIILGGGVMNQHHLFPRIREHVGRLLNGYIQAELILDDIESYIVPPTLGNRSGVLGAIALASEASGRPD